MNVPADKAFLRVPGKWLQLCGLSADGQHDAVFRVLELTTYMRGTRTFATVDNGSGCPWVVDVECRHATFLPADYATAKTQLTVRRSSAYLAVVDEQGLAIYTACSFVGGLSARGFPQAWGGVAYAFTHPVP